MFTGLYRWNDGVIESVIEDQHINLTDWLKLISSYDQPIIISGDTDSFEDGMRSVLHSRLIVADSLAAIPSAAKLGRYGRSKSPVTNVDAVVPRYLRLTKAEADWKNYILTRIRMIMLKKFKDWFSKQFYNKEVQLRERYLDIKITMLKLTELNISWLRP